MHRISLKTGLEFIVPASSWRGGAAAREIVFIVKLWVRPGDVAGMFSPVQRPGNRKHGGNTVQVQAVTPLIRLWDTAEPLFPGSITP